MKSLAYIPASNQAANASLMTVQTVRAAGASDIIVNTVTGVPTKFFGSMGAPHTFIDPVTGETITIISEATAVDFAGHIDSGKVVIDVIAPGYVDTRGSLVGDIVVLKPNTEWANNIFNVLSEAHNDDGTIKNTAIPGVADFVQSGGGWFGLTGLNAGMTALVAYQNTIRGTIAALATRAFTASKDTYVDILRNSTTNAFSLVYTEVANNAASPALAANSIRLAKVITSGSAITGVIQYDRDSLYNLIRPTLSAANQSLYLQGTGSSMSFTAPFDGILEAEHSFGAWGFAGGTFGQTINCNNNAVRLTEQRSFVTGSDTVPRFMRESAVFANIVKGQSYTVGTAAWTGSGGGSAANSERMSLKLIPK